MESGGYYEQMMREGMEKLFSIEPYKSLRNRFNVYSVKVVSPNNLFYRVRKLQYRKIMSYVLNMLVKYQV